MHDDPNVKLCECGCGQPAPIARTTSARDGWVKGQPKRFIHGHHGRGKPRSSETRKKIGDSQRGDGTYHNASGRFVQVGIDHPMADANGWVADYRLILADHLGRMLSSDEHVHHIDCDRQNNSIENLVVVTQSQHARIHWLIRRGSDPFDAVREVLA